MARQVASRTQRRMEKKQALVLVFLVLAVSLVSFTLGVMVGRGGSHSSVAEEIAAPPTRMTVAKEGFKEQAAEEAPAFEEEPAQDLTFYDALPSGEQPPLGSGINLPPQEEQAQSKSKISASAVKAEAEKPRTSAPLPEVSSGGTYAVQVASFKGVGDAGKLRDRLAEKGYEAFVREADLGAKGTWYRVMIGPYSSADAGARVVARLKSEEKLSAIVKKQ